VRVAKTEYVLKFEISQKQDEPYDLDVPVVLHLENESQAFRTFINTNQQSESFEIKFSSKPLILEIDPEFDVFRKLHPIETPATLSRLLGSEKTLILLPSESPEIKFYEEFAMNWSKDKENPIEIKKDSEIAKLPENKSVWVLGAENRFYETAVKNIEIYSIKGDKNRSFIINNQSFDDTHTFVFSDANPLNPEHAVGLIIPAKPENLNLLSGKLPHYGKYSFLVFDKNISQIKSGIWETKTSPLSVKFEENASQIKYPQRKPLIYPVSEFSNESIFEHIKFLSSDKLKGRYIDTHEIDKAGDYIAKHFQFHGLVPFNSKNFFHQWTQDVGGRNYKLKNILAVLKGKNPKFSDEYVVISAHYDHGGEKNGKIYYGADDNASGVALMLELAKYFSRNRTERSLLFAAFTAEEHGRIGSKHFISQLKQEEIKKINAAINLDTIGRLHNAKVIILNANSSDKWMHIFRGAGFVTGVETEPVQQNLDSSDQMSFIEKGVPGVQIFTGAYADFHKPTDTADKIDINGIVKIGELVKEIIEYLAGDTDFISRPEIPSLKSLSSPPLSKGDQSGFDKNKEPKTERKVSLGFIPDFTYTGKGVKIGEIIANSPLFKTCAKPGDVIVQIDGMEITSLKEYSEELKKRNPGDKIELVIICNGEEKNITSELIEK
jgi:hypothetical protein